MYWVIHEYDLKMMLADVANGEDPDMVYLEYYANSDQVRETDG